MLALQRDPLAAAGSPELGGDRGGRGRREPRRAPPLGLVWRRRPPRGAGRAADLAAGWPQRHRACPAVRHSQRNRAGKRYPVCAEVVRMCLLTVKGRDRQAAGRVRQTYAGMPSRQQNPTPLLAAQLAAKRLTDNADDPSCPPAQPSESVFTKAPFCEFITSDYIVRKRQETVVTQFESNSSTIRRASDIAFSFFDREAI